MRARFSPGPLDDACLILLGRWFKIKGSEISKIRKEILKETLLWLAAFLAGMLAFFNDDLFSLAILFLLGIPSVSLLVASKESSQVKSVLDGTGSSWRRRAMRKAVSFIVLYNFLAIVVLLLINFAIGKRPLVLNGFTVFLGFEIGILLATVFLEWIAVKVWPPLSLLLLFGDFSTEE